LNQSSYVRPLEMLRQSLLPLSRQRLVQPGRLAVTSTFQSRLYARSRDYYLGDQGDYKLPSTAQKPAWQQTSSFASKSPKEPLRRVPGDEEEFKFDDAEQSPGTIKPASQRPAEEGPSDSSSQSTSSPESTPEFEPSETEPVPQRPLPDLTKGIPSTLDAELSQAQSRRHASRSSLNITEDPAEPLPSEGEDPGDRAPRAEYVSSSDKKKNAAVRYTYLILALGLVGYTAYLGRNWDSEEEEKKHADAPSGWGFGLFYDRVKARMSSTMSYYNDPVTTKLLPDEEQDPAYRKPFTLVLSLEDMLVHQEWTRENGWRIAKRPGLDYFLRYLSYYYELVLFTSQPSAMGDQVMRKLDPFMMVRWPLYREATLYKDGGYIKA
jgi:mitochondrial import inner membrane translocase subunit TIM50